MLVKMKSLTDFHNERLVTEDGRKTVKSGETFETDWLHARDLAAGRLAEPLDAKALEREPTEAMDPHSGISAPDLAALNARRAAADKAAAEKAAAEKAAAEKAAAEAGGGNRTK